MARRKGMMVGKGKKGYHNVVPKDKVVHSQSAKGRKQPQRISPMKTMFGNSDLSIFNKSINKFHDTIKGLDEFERKQFEDYRKSGQSIENALAVLVNTVEGDISQLSPVLREYAVKSGLLEGFDYKEQLTEEEKKWIPQSYDDDDDDDTKRYNDAKRHSECAKGIKKNIFNYLNKKAPSRDGMEKSGTTLFTTDLKNTEEDINKEIKEGYADSYEIVPITDTDSVNRYKIIYYQKPQKYSFYWKRGGEKVYKNSNDLTAKQSLAKFRKRKIEPAYQYPVSSVEQNMFLSSISEAIKIAKPKDAKALMIKARKIIQITPYTNWSGD